MPTSNVFYSFVRCLACKDIVRGYPCGGTNPQTGQAEPCDANRNAYYRYGNDVSRGQIAKIVSLSAGFNDDPGAQIYSDVPPGSTFYTWINILTRRGIVGGYPCPLNAEGRPDDNCVPYGSQFRPELSATRGQLSKIVSNAAGYIENHTEQTFEDVPPGSTFYQFVQRLTSRGVMSGYACTLNSTTEPCVPPTNRAYFRPGNTVTRGQTAKIVSNTFFPNCSTLK